MAQKQVTRITLFAVSLVGVYATLIVAAVKGRNIVITFGEIRIEVNHSDTCDLVFDNIAMM